MQEEHVESLARLSVSIYWLECGFRWWLNWQHHYECIMLSIFERRKIQHSLDDTAEIRRSSQLRLSPAREHGQFVFVCLFGDLIDILAPDMAGTMTSQLAQG
jgi:hypothetical protein